MTGNEPLSKYMTTQLITLHPEMDIREATKIMIKHKISGAPVVDKKGNLIGILSERDCIRTVVDGHYNQRPSGKGIVEEYMSVNVKTLDISKTILEAAYEFVHFPYKRFPVLENGKLVGQISRSDVLKAVVSLTPKVKIVPDTWKAREPMG